MADYLDVDVQVHKAVDPSDAVPLQQLEALVSSALRYKGAKAITDTPPAKPAQGDVYIFSNSGALTHDWLPIKQGQTVTLHEAVFFDGTNWDLLGSVTSGGTTIHDVRGTAPVSVNNTNAARPVISVASATETSEGVVELATVAEAKAGTDTQRAVTPAGLEAKAAALKAEFPVIQHEPTSILGTTWVPNNPIIINTRGGNYQLGIDSPTDNKVGAVRWCTPAEGQSKTSVDAALRPQDVAKLRETVHTVNGLSQTNQGDVLTLQKSVKDLQTKAGNIEVKADNNAVSITNLNTQRVANEQRITALESKAPAAQVKWEVISLAAYQALATKDPNTLYVINQ